MKGTNKHSQNKLSHPNCTVVEYPFVEKDVDIGLFYINGRYPEKGVCFNETCQIQIYVIRGKGVLEVEGQLIVFEQGDALSVPINARYYLEGDFEGAFSSTPTFYSEQHKVILD